MMRGDAVMTSHCAKARLKLAGIAVVLALALLVMGPFSVALGIHHLLAEADHDGHQHSDSDICQWVQHHSGESLFFDPPRVEAFLIPVVHRFLEPSLLLTTWLCKASQSRAPPVC